MRHDELLAKVNAPNATDQDTYLAPYKALRKVLELHKPFEISGEEFCDVCEERTDDGVRHRTYPCPTIEAIDEELL